MYKIVYNLLEEFKLDIKEIIEKSGLNQTQFALKYEIPLRTLQSWIAGARTPPKYVTSLLSKIVAVDNLREVGLFKRMLAKWHDKERKLNREWQIDDVSTIYVQNRRKNKNYYDTRLAIGATCLSDGERYVLFDGGIGRISARKIDK